jgi:hypothetical protein
VGGNEVDGRFSAEVPEVLAGSTRWAASAATFADVIPPVIASVWPSAAAAGAIHGVVSASHAQFGARLAETAAGAQAAGTSYDVMDVEQNAQALSELIGGA